MRLLVFLAAGALAMSSVASPAQEPVPSLELEDAKLLSAFGERAAFSPDGSRVAFVGQSYGDAFEIDLATGKVRNLTGHLPHQGVLRMQYLENGDYLISGPKRNIGPNSRISVDLFVLDKDLETGLQPLDQSVFEGVAVGPRNLIAWQQLAPGEALRPGESWIEAIQRLSFEHHVGRIEYQEGKPRIVEQRRILSPPPRGCRFSELQDFRDNGNEVLFYCAGSTADGASGMGIFGVDLRTGEFIPYRPITSDYAEIEGVAPGGEWTTVECADVMGGNHGVPPLGICRLELVPNGKLSKLVVATSPGSTRKVSNPVVSPDGRSIAFQAADARIGEPGEGGGIYLVEIGD